MRRIRRALAYFTCGVTSGRGHPCNLAATDGHAMHLCASGMLLLVTA